MSKLVYSMMVSLDGFIESQDRKLDWVVIDEELHRFANEEARATGAFLYGRRLYENMAAYWPIAEEDPSIPDYMVEFAQIWKAKPKLVFSRTLAKVDWNSRLVRDNAAEEVAKLKAQAGAELSVGGRDLASTFVRLGLVDEYRVILQPVVLGGGTPFLPALDSPIKLRLLETRSFASGVVYLRYQPADQERQRTPRAAR